MKTLLALCFTLFSAGCATEFRYVVPVVYEGRNVLAPPPGPVSADHQYQSPPLSAFAPRYEYVPVVPHYYTLPCFACWPAYSSTTIIINRKKK